MARLLRRAAGKDIARRDGADSGGPSAPGLLWGSDLCKRINIATEAIVKRSVSIWDLDACLVTAPLSRSAGRPLELSPVQTRFGPHDCRSWRPRVVSKDLGRAEDGGAKCMTSPAIWWRPAKVVINRLKKVPHQKSPKTWPPIPPSDGGGGGDKILKKYSTACRGTEHASTF